MQADEHAVVQAHVAKGIRTLGRVDVENLVVEGGQFVGIIVHVLFTVGGELRCRAHEGRGGVPVQGVRRVPGGVSAVLEFLDEGEGNAEGLVCKNGHLPIAVGGGSQVHVDFANIHRGVPDPQVVHHTAAFLPGNLVVNEAGMGHVALAQVVAAHKVGAVVRLFVLEGTGAAVAFHFQGDVKRGKDVLRGENAKVVGA